MTKLLLIDDDKSVRESLKPSLESEGYEVFTAGDAANGLEIFCRENPYIVLTAIRMPDLDGIEVLRKAKAQDTDAQLLVLTVNGKLRLFRVLLRWQVSWDTRGGHGSHKVGFDPIFSW